MPSDNPATVATGTPILFPQDGPASATAGIVRTGTATFNLVNIGVYQVTYQASVTEAGQVRLTLDGVAIPSTAAGRATGTSQIVGTAIVRTTVANSILSLVNSSPGVLTLTPFAGGAQAVAAQLVIVRIQ
jgi:hypothetical protein